MTDLRKITRNFVKACVLKEELEVLEENLFEAGTVSAQIQAIFEVMSNIRLTSNRDRNRMSLARENMKKVRRHVKKLEEKVVVLQEQITILEESEKKSEIKEG